MLSWRRSRDCVDGGKHRSEVKDWHPAAKSFDTNIDAEKWARNLEAELIVMEACANTRLAERMTIRDLLARYLEEITPHKRSGSTEAYRGQAPRCCLACRGVIRDLNTLAHSKPTFRKQPE